MGKLGEQTNCRRADLGREYFGTDGNALNGQSCSAKISRQTYRGEERSRKESQKADSHGLGDEIGNPLLVSQSLQFYKNRVYTNSQNTSCRPTQSTAYTNTMPRSPQR